MNQIEIPEEVIDMQLRAGGPAGRAWIERLPALVGELAGRWGLAIAPPFQGGCTGFVAPAERSDGSSVVIKINRLDDVETQHEGEALSFWDGRGAVRLLDLDRLRGAMLLERLQPGTFLADHPDRDEAISVACRLLRRLWREVSEPNPFRTVRDLDLRWADELPDRFAQAGEPFERSLLQTATDLCRELADPMERSVLANSDFHLWNVLAARREPWLMIDPKPLLGERAFDTGHFLRTLIPEHPDREVVLDLVHRLAAELDLDAQRIRAWGFVRSIEDALWGPSVGFADDPRDLLIARLLA